MNPWVVCENWFELCSPWACWVFSDVGHQCNIGTITNTELWSTDVRTSILGELGFQCFEGGRENSFNNSIDLGHGLLLCASTSRHFESKTICFVMHVNPSIKEGVNLGGTSPVLCIIISMHLTEHSQGSHRLSVLFAVDANSWQASEFTSFTLRLDLTPLIEIVSDVLVINLGVMEKHSDWIGSTITHAEIFYSHKRLFTTGLCFTV